MSAPLASLRDVGVSFGSTPVLRDVDLDIDPGSAVGVTGANGAGKSTLLGVIATMLRPTTGSVTVFGVGHGDPDLRSARRRIGISSHDDALYPELTLHENLRFIERLTAAPRLSAAKALEVVGLAGAAERRLSEASNGMRRRTDLARLLMTRPDLVLLDEAYAGLDAPARSIVDRLVHRTCEAGGAAVIVSHDESVLDGMVDRVVRVEAGTVS